MDRVVGVAGIVPRGKTVLVLRRAQTDRFMPGAFDLPGGGLIQDESPEEGIIREVYEETGLHTEIVKSLGLRSYLPNYGPDKLMVVYLLRVKGPVEVQLSKEHDAFRWVSDESLGGVFPPSDLMGVIIHEYFQSIQTS